MVESTPVTRRSSRLRRGAADQGEPANNEASSQATEDTTQASGVSTRRRAGRSGAGSGAQSRALATPAVPATVRRSQRRQAQQEAESPLHDAGEGAAGGETQIPAPARWPADADGPSAASAAAAELEQPVDAAMDPAQTSLTSAAEPPAAASSARVAADAGPASSGGRAAPDASSSSGSDGEDDGGAGPTALQLEDSFLAHLAADMAAALAPQRLASADGAQGLTTSAGAADEGIETDMLDGSSSESESDVEAAGGAGRATGNGLTKAERAALHWVPEPRLPLPAAGDESLDRLEAAARRGLAAQAQQVVAPPRDARRLAREQRRAAPDTAGNGWFDLPATQITPQARAVKQDLRMLALRGVFDPKRFYRAPDATKFPKYFQMGTVVAGPTDFYSGRLTRKEQKQTLTEELLADQQLQAAHKRRFGKLQEERSRFSDKRAIAKRKTSNPRLQARRKRPKH